LLIGAVYSADYSLVLGVTAISIIAVSAAVFLIDILYPIFDPRVKLA
jgi:peptide/nickel transport system permease protein